MGKSGWIVGVLGVLLFISLAGGIFGALYAYQQGYTVGHEQGYQQGETSGYQKGMKDGNTQGASVGYSNGSQDEDALWRKWWVQNCWSATWTSTGAQGYFCMTVGP